MYVYKMYACKMYVCKYFYMDVKYVCNVLNIEIKRY